jgi:hypothetical protein
MTLLMFFNKSDKNAKKNHEIHITLFFSELITVKP